METSQFKNLMKHYIIKKKILEDMEWNLNNDFRQQLTIYGVIQTIQASSSFIHYPFPEVGKHPFLGRVGKDNSGLHVSFGSYGLVVAKGQAECLDTIYVFRHRDYHYHHINLCSTEAAMTDPRIQKFV